LLEKKCKLKKAQAKDILKNVIARQRGEEKKNQKFQAKLHAQKTICELLSSYCGNICIRDVFIERDDICDEMCCKTFTAFGMLWEMVLVSCKTQSRRTTRSSSSRTSERNAERKDSLNSSGPNADSKTQEMKVGVRLRAVSTVKRKVRLRFFVLKGPSLDIEMQPTIHRVVFKRGKSKESEICYLGFQPKDGPKVHELERLHLRVGLVDTRRRVSAEFSTDVPTRRAGDSQDLDDTDSDVSSLTSTEYDDEEHSENDESLFSENDRDYSDTHIYF